MSLLSSPRQTMCLCNEFQDDQTCWTEAIKASSSTNFRSSTVTAVSNSYDMVSDMYPHKMQELQPLIVTLIDETEITTATQMVQHPPVISWIEASKYTDDELHAYVGLDSEPYHYYDAVQTPPPPQGELESISEISSEQLTNFDPKEAQLWMQRVENIPTLKPVSPSANEQHTKPELATLSKAFPPPSEEVDDDGYDYIDSEQQGKSFLTQSTLQNLVEIGGMVVNS